MNFRKTLMYNMFISTARWREHKTVPSKKSLRSHGGFSCKIQALTDAMGIPLKFILTGGQVADIFQAQPLLQRIKAGALLANSGCF